MHRLAVGLVAAIALAASGMPGFALPSATKFFSPGNFCPLVLASSKLRLAQAPCRQTGGTRAAPVCGGSCDYTVCNVLRDAQNRPYCGCG
jgi:hypothetical protein